MVVLYFVQEGMGAVSMEIAVEEWQGMGNLGDYIEVEDWFLVVFVMKMEQV